VLYVGASLIGYLLGSFPTAYVVMKSARDGVDILKNGTGNVGAMNVYEVSGSKSLGLIVGVIDILKGLVVTFIFGHHFGVLAGSTAGLFAVTGHNYSLYVKFRGGRGLATAAGVLLVIQPLAVAAYLAVYFILRIVRLKLYVSSVIGILAAFVPVVARFMTQAGTLAIMSTMFLIVLSKHLLPLKYEFEDAH